MAGRYVRMGDSMVEVVEDSPATAGGSGAGGSAGANEVLKSSGGGVPGLGVRVVALSLNDRAEGDVQAADQVG